MGEPSIIVDYDVCYLDSVAPSWFPPGWYFWFLDQYDRIVSEPIGPYAEVEDAMRSGKVAVNVYYDE